MFVIDLKPKHYIYPLQKPQFRQICQNQLQTLEKITKLQSELQQISQRPDHDKYRSYSQRLVQKIKIYLEQIKVNERITQTHSEIDKLMSQDKRNLSQVKQKLLQNYKYCMNDNRKRKQSEKKKSIEAQNQMINQSQLNQHRKKYNISTKRNSFQYNKISKPSKSFFVDVLPTSQLNPEAGYNSHQVNFQLPPINQLKSSVNRDTKTKIQLKIRNLNESHKWKYEQCSFRNSRFGRKISQSLKDPMNSGPYKIDRLVIE